jgi:AcrR family transcriptional regulator
MPSFTRRAIRESFLKLLEERPLNQITIKDIVADCGINRNSFYYHYEDLPALIEEIIKDEADRIIREHAAIGSLEECLEIAISFAQAHKKAVWHIYNSVSRDLYERYLLDICQYVVTAYADTAFTDIPIKETDRPIIIRYYKCVCFGLIIDWLNAGMKDDVIEQFRRLCTLQKGMTEELLLRSANS